MIFVFILKYQITHELGIQTIYNKTKNVCFSVNIKYLCDDNIVLFQKGLFAHEWIEW